jgi:hypothetical protein
MSAVKQAMLEEMDAENRQQEKKEQEKYLLEDILERQHEEYLIENSIQGQIEEDCEQDQIEEEYECKLSGEPYFSPRIVMIAEGLLNAKGADIK